MLLKNVAKLASISDEFVGAAGCRYRFKQLLQERPHLGRVSLATFKLPRRSYYLTRKLTSYQIRAKQVCPYRYP
jgi:hypothetical protein